jgi:exodeoxyribonuclease-1
VSQFVDGEEGFVLTEFYGGEPYHRAVVCIGRNPTNPNGRFCLDLSVAPEVWRGMSDSEARAAIARKGTPVRRVRVNGAPTLTDLYNASDEMLGGLDQALAESRAREFMQDAPLCKRIADLYSASWDELPPSPHPERRLYSDGFPSDADQHRMFEFHEATAHRRLKLAGEFQDRRLQTFAQRLVHNEHRTLLAPSAQRAADFALAQRLIEDSAGPLTLPQALAATDAMLGDVIGDPLGLLADYRQYLVARIDRISRFRAEPVA